MTRKEYQYVQWLVNHRINDMGEVERQCTQCKEWKIENFDNYSYKNKNKIEMGFSPWCKECNTKRQLYKYYNDGGLTKQRTIEIAAIRYHTVESDREIKLRNGQRQREEGYQAQWQKENPDKCRGYSSLHRIHDITPNEWRKTLKVFDHRCIYCNMTQQESLKKYGERLHQDHADHDGANDLRNALPACKGCNCSKHQDLIEEWYPKQKFFSEDRYNKIIWWLTEGYLDIIEDKPPYRIIKERNEGLTTFHFNLWTVDEQRNIIEKVDTKSKKKYLDLNLL